MPISFACPCGRALHAKDELAGKKTKCPGCGSVLTIPVSEEKSLDEDDVAGFLTQADSKPSPAVPVQHESYEPIPDPRETTLVPSPGRRAKEPAGKVAKGPVDTEPATGSLREYSYWLLLFAMIPLGFSLLGSEEHALIERLKATIEKLPPEQGQRVLAALEQGADLTFDELFAVLPDRKLEGAHLSQGTYVHWAYAGVAIAGFLLLTLLMFSVERAQPLHLLGIGLFTGTVGIVFLFAVQFCSQIRLTSIRGRGVFALILLILALIGLSYRSALDEDSNFFLSAVGYTFGVGLCEELTKAIPLLFYYKRDALMGWRGACLWGLASGIGFGVSEGIMYSADSYNGISGAGIYVVRFVSCVALHAMWAGAGAIAIERTRHAYDAVEDWMGFGLYILRVLAVPMVLHGFYDTLLKKDMNAWALVVALASFGWFAFQIERARGQAPESGIETRRRRHA
jgi:RsiW-degrading membrane proteinase PrsW (M82 family)